MVDERSPRLERSTLLLAAAVTSLAGLAALGALTVLDIDLGLSLTVSPHRVTVGTVLAATLVVVGALALPAYVLSSWQSAQDAATRKRRQ